MCGLHHSGTHSIVYPVLKQSPLAATPISERTCRVEREHVDVDGERMTDYSCGCFNQSGWGHNYCPNCGARVVSE